MNNILSIDLDILFSPYVGIYNAEIKDLSTYEYSWDIINMQYNQKSFIPNQQYYNIIKEIIFHYINQIPYIYLGEDHSSILTVIEENKSIFNLPYNFNIYNIDFHHDILYQKEHISNFEKKISNCSNWVGFLNYYNFLNEYNWWGAPCSSFDQTLFDKEFENIMPKKFKKYILDNRFPLDLNIDILYITFSTPWIPPYYYFIIRELLKDIDKNKIKYLPYPFIPGGFIKPFLNLSGNKSYEELKYLIDN